MKDKLALWNDVCHTDPAHAKTVSYGRKFTAIDAMYQVRTATEVFGQVGQGWWYDASYSVIDTPTGHQIACADVVMNYLDDDPACEPKASYGPVRGCAVLFTPPPPVDQKSLQDRLVENFYSKDGRANTKGLTNALRDIDKSFQPRIDNDAFKKALTDALTKLLSHLGMNADVFLGMFDDNKYVAEMRERFDPKTAEATKYLGPIRQAIKEEDSLAAVQLIEELKDPENDNALASALWGMLSSYERTMLGQWLKEARDNADK
jgi:hypothetical protein